MEKVNLKQIHSLAKVIGTGITLLGAMLMTFYKGPVVDILPHSLGRSRHETASTFGSADQHWITGTIMLLSCIVGWSGFFIVQVSSMSIQIGLDKIITKLYLVLSNRAYQICRLRTLEFIEIFSFRFN